MLDMTDPQEQADLDVMKAAIEKKRLDTYNYMASVLKYTDNDMKHSGYGKFTKAEAIEKILRDSIKETDKIIAAHIKRYPDK